MHPAPTQAYSLSLHDALPISTRPPETWDQLRAAAAAIQKLGGGVRGYGVQSNEQYRLFKKFMPRSEEHTSELQSQSNLVCRLLLEKKKARAAGAIVEVDLGET